MLIYSAKNKDCQCYPLKAKCISSRKLHKEIFRRVFAEYREAGKARVDTFMYKQIMKQKPFACEDNFILQKCCPNLRFIRFRGIDNVTIQCLLSLSALNLKR